MGDLGWRGGVRAARACVATVCAVCWRYFTVATGGGRRGGDYSQQHTVAISAAAAAAAGDQAAVCRPAAAVVLRLNSGLIC
jgi:hypothetical protein